MKTSEGIPQECSSCSAGKRLRDCRTQTARSPASNRFVTFGMIGVLLICLIIISTIQVSEGGPTGRRRGKQAEASENDITVDESGRGRRRKKPNTHKPLRTSEEARNITERRYLRKDWCKKRPLKQFIRLKNGCKGYFLNNFCYGQCNSFYIPRELTPEAKEQEAFRSCAFCKPFRVEKVSVTLTCSRKRNNRVKKIKKMVNRIQDCRCIAVPDIDARTPAPGRSL